MSILRSITTALLVLGTVIQARAEFIDERTPVKQTAAKPSVGQRAPAVTDAGSPPAQEAAPLELRKGKPVFEQLRVYGKQTGWDLVWGGAGEAPLYVLDRDWSGPPDFEAAIAHFLNGVNEAGIRLRATFYRGNKTVRVSEF